jgi:putative membrane protein
MVLAVLLLGVLIAGVVLIVRSLGEGSSGAPIEGSGPPRARAEGSGPPPAPEATRQSDALDLLDVRYARGEIDREEYLRIREDLTSRGGSG